ncbi:CaiB/BaiF CoA-transferase family protein [Paraflavitalea sp. CAU 1676]|uniref:CaiB/BaiF CoA transferase family protein n=1 Tax=Paraflavitalea sp. CAU 1676 TaxID=3032598 RepID=UPI0023DABBAC|nr:CaiB/BaiF CoA-transferase family protein [Paraflavitalea sp. CAU 1676]MDF2190425.1 CaiB/BaiF CoA-transferase family protein [Paraflavitalea sp. CAU 1676]
MKPLPLDGLIVLEFSQYLSGPSAGLRLADLGARVIKIERPGVGDAGRKLSIKNLWADESSMLFHTINRNKESFTADLRNSEELELVKKLIRKADVVTHNFRPGVMKRAGLDYAAVQQINPRIVYGEISGYGKVGPWKDKPGQDLLVQSLAGLMYTTGNDDNDPVPFGLSIADSLCGAQLVQGILAGLIRRHKTGKGALIEVSLLESLLDFQFELLTTYHNGGQLPRRSSVNNGHPLLSAPYGLYATANGFIAIAMSDLATLATALHCIELSNYTAAHAFVNRDEIKRIISAHVVHHSSQVWLAKLHEHHLWAMEVLDWKKLTGHTGYQHLRMEQTIHASNRKEIVTTRCPIRINGKILTSGKAAPGLGAHNEDIIQNLLNEN